MTDVNTFTQIALDDCEHVVYRNYTSPVPGNMQNAYTTVLDDLLHIVDHKFTKKYNIIYSADSLDCINDPIHSRVQKTNAIKTVAERHKDKVFVLIDHDRIDDYTLLQMENCHVWKRKYYSESYALSHNKISPGTEISQTKNHWLTCCMGRADFWRTKMFHWLFDNMLTRGNKVSYLALSGGQGERIIEPKTLKSNYIATGGRKELQSFIPFNNFENSLPDNATRIGNVRAVHDCLFNIVVEGYITDGASDISEKSLDTAVFGNVPIIISGPGTMQKFQGMGFIVPDYIKWPIWDDLIIDDPNIGKMEIIQKQLIDFMEKNDIGEIAKDWFPYAVRNFETFKKLKHNCLEEEKQICKWILAITKSIDNPNYQKLYQ